MTSRRRGTGFDHSPSSNLARNESPFLARPRSRSTLRFEHRANLYSAAAGPALRHRQSLVEVGHLDLGVAADQLVPFDERPVADQRLAAAVAHGRGRLPRLELVRTA